MHSLAPTVRASIGLDFGIQHFLGLVAVYPHPVHCPRCWTRSGRRQGVRLEVDTNCKLCSSPGRIEVVAENEAVAELPAAKVLSGNDAFAELAGLVPVVGHGNDSGGWLTIGRRV